MLRMSNLKFSLLLATIAILVALAAAHSDTEQSEVAAGDIREAAVQRPRRSPKKRINKRKKKTNRRRKAGSKKRTPKRFRKAGSRQANCFNKLRSINFPLLENQRKQLKRFETNQKIIEKKAEKVM